MKETSNILFLLAGIGKNEKSTSDYTAQVKSTLISIGASEFDLNHYECIGCNSSWDREEYKEKYDKKDISQLLEETAKKILESDFKPNLIILLYRKIKDFDKLLKEFGFFVCPVSVHVETKNQKAICRSYVNSAKAVAKRKIDDVKFVFRTLKEINKYSRHFFLPPKNFYIKDSACENIFQNIYDGNISWQDSIKHFPQYTNHSILYGGTRCGYKDSRGLLFESDKPHQTLEEFPYGIEKIRLFKHKLNKRFRFGIPIPEGVHFDVKLTQASTTKDFSKIKLFHSPKDILAYPPLEHKNYANIYPHDFIRWVIGR